jgi:primosomal protein N' (replication factor Y) (superfamily II helicase)
VVSGRIATVVPDVTGLDKHFDYVVPEEIADRVRVGTLVRVELHGRRIGGWVVALADEVSAGRPVESSKPIALKPIMKVTGHGPSTDLIDLASWASVRWAARRIRPFLVTASPPRAVVSLPRDRRTGRTPAPQSPATRDLLAAGGGVLRLPPRADTMPAVLAAAALGPALVIVPDHEGAALLAIRLRRAGVSVAAVPEDWAAAAAGVDVVVGTRSAAWAPCPGLAAAVVLDEHDEALQEERAPTWHARDVVVERCRRAGVPYVLVSPAPTLVAVVEYAGVRGVVHPPAARERGGWPRVEVVDRTDDPWKRSLVTTELIERVRDPAATVVCVSNTTGRARILACRACRALIRCERCDAAVGLDDAGRLACRRCGAGRPAVCQVCGAGRFANLRPGVTRLREEIEAAAARRVVQVTAADPLPPPTGAPTVFVGTEAVLHRIAVADVVVFLEFDSELLAPRFRAAEQALALIVRAGRIAPEVMVQTFSPDHEVLAAVRAGDPSLILDGEQARRRLLGLPPFGALAVVTGEGASEVAAQVRDCPGIEVGGDADRLLVRAPGWTALGEALNAAERPPGTRIRVEVDPARL